MAPLHVFVYLLGLVVLSHSACFFRQLEVKDVNNPPKGCVDEDGKQHAFGTKWMRDCKACSCTTAGLSCCDMIPEAVNVPQECELVVNRKTCSGKVVLKSDKTKLCNPV
ncbi:Beta-microseminoprotein [Channa argus]|uniref:Beta-microseminoprotein n=1 Tax=Channa argus TaxID=215402 RepID=A0A6G1R1P9_CHAAH|nr:Beta-microseminoprotein [Channa argus]KAK2921945.1 hypothetical protein Q8A73_001430 [Channa argus]